MAEYIEREAAIKSAVCALHGVSQIVAVDVVEALEEAPAADVVEVVRCKDCEYSEMCFPCKAFGLEAPPVYVCRFGHRNREVLPNDYCSCGAKMDGKGEGE